METAARDSGLNPYAPPRSDLGGGKLTEYYRSDSRRFRYGEYWRIAPNPIAFGIAAVLKTLRIPVRRTHAIAYPRELIIVPWEDVPPHIQDSWRKRLEECAEAGFRRAFCYTNSFEGITKEALSVFLLTEDRLCSASLTYVRVETATQLKVVTRLRDCHRISWSTLVPQRGSIGKPRATPWVSRPGDNVLPGPERAFRRRIRPFQGERIIKYSIRS